MEAITHIFLVFFYCLSGAVILIYLLVRWAINYRLNSVRLTIRSYTKRTRSMATVNYGLAKLNEVLTEKERAKINTTLNAVKAKSQEENDDINNGIRNLYHTVSHLEYKSTTDPGILWPSWAKRKLQNIIREMQELRALAEQATQY